jgi:hypothetical protein
MIAGNRPGTIQLFRKQHADHAMGQREARQPQEGVGALLKGRVEAIRPTD